MMSHYVINDKLLESNIKEIKYTFRNQEFTFKTDLGVFSKDRVDFGTNLLINSFLDSDLKNKKILDLGCGYGIIGILIAKIYKDSYIDMVDINLRALQLTKQNALSNLVKNVNIYESNLFSNIITKFDLIISNPPIRAGKEVVHGIIADGYNHLNPNGIIQVVIQKKQGAESLMKKMEEIFSNLEIVKKDKGYFILRSIKQ